MNGDIHGPHASFTDKLNYNNWQCTLLLAQMQWILKTQYMHRAYSGKQRKVYAVRRHDGPMYPEAARDYQSGVYPQLAWRNGSALIMHAQSHLEVADKIHGMVAMYLASSRAPRCMLSNHHCYQEFHMPLERCHNPLAMQVSVSSLQLLGSLECFMVGRGAASTRHNSF